MHKIKLSDVKRSEKTLTQAVLQITQMLGLYHAELARILHLQCADVGDLYHAHISMNSVAWIQAEKYIELYEYLYNLYDGNEALINNWLRKKNKNLRRVPLYLMVDESGIDDVLKILKQTL